MTDTDIGLIEQVARTKTRKRKGKRLERLRELTFSPADADLCWMLVRATALSAAVQEALFEQPLRTRDDRVLALEITLEAIEQKRCDFVGGP